MLLALFAFVVKRKRKTEVKRINRHTENEEKNGKELNIKRKVVDRKKEKKTMLQFKPINRFIVRVRPRVNSKEKQSQRGNELHQNTSIGCAMGQWKTGLDRSKK